MPLLDRCLSSLTDAALAEAVIGDLHEIRSRRRSVSPISAMVWFWCAALGIVWHAAAQRIRAVVVATATRQAFGSGLGGDLRHTVRMLRRAPGFAIAAIVLLALGIGASTAIFSVVYGVTMRPLPYPAPDRLVRLYETNVANGKLKEDVSEPAFHEWRTSVQALASAAIYGDPRLRFLKGSTDQPMTTRSVSPAFFDVLGVAPMLGAGFKAEPEYTAATRRELVISHAAWRRLYGLDPAVLGRHLRFDDDDEAPYRIVGVMPEGFVFDGAVDFWQPSLIRLPLGRITRSWRYDRVIARLRPEASIDQARTELESVAARLGRDFPGHHGGWTVTVEPLQDAVVGTFGRVKWFLLATVTVVLAVTYLNVGGLLVARSVARERDTAVRAALGAGRWRLIQLRLAEAAVLGGAGASSGVLLAWAAVSALKAAAPPGLPRIEEIALDTRTFAVAALSALTAVVFFTLLPARVRRHQLMDRLRGGSHGAGGHRDWQTARLALMMAQCAGAAALVVLSLMLTRSFIKLTSVDLGWQPHGMVSVTLSPPMPRELRRPWFRYVEWSDRLIARLEASPGIGRAAVTTQVPLSPQPFPSTVARGRGRASGESARWPVINHNVTDGYFEAMQIRLLAGRTFNRSDRFPEAVVNGLERVERGGVVVSETTARTLWPNGEAVGQSLWFADNVDNVTWREVVGVVSDIHFQSVGEAPGLHVFVPWTQLATGRPRLLVKTTEGATSVALIREVIEQVEPGTRIESVAPMEALFHTVTAQPRYTSHLVAGFGTLALILAAVGIYGTLSYLVTTRRRELGVRLALGATPSQVMSTMLRRGVVPALAGGVIGLAAAVAVARVFRAVLFEVEPIDPLSVAGGATVLAVVAVAAALLPARRAARLDPTAALRSE